MKARPGLLFTFPDGREIALPFPAVDRMVAVFALVPKPGASETAAQFAGRFIRQTDILLESARWLTTPAAGLAPAAAITGATLTLSEARQLSNATMAHALGADAQKFTTEMERVAAAAGVADLQHIPLGQMLELFRTHSL